MKPIRFGSAVLLTLVVSNVVPPTSTFASALETTGGLGDSDDVDPMEVINSQDNDHADSSSIGGKAADFNDRTYLDVFAEVANEFLTQKLIPDTDDSCHWDWKYVRCEPFCSCSYKPLFGDYHLGRSCRQQVKENCDPVESRPNANQFQIMVQRLLSVTERSIHAVTSKTKEKYGTLQAHVCKDLPEISCKDEEEIPLLAWQEKLFCRSMLPECAFEMSWPNIKIPPSLLQNKFGLQQSTEES